MSHFAQVIDGIVQQVIVAEQDQIDLLMPDPENWIQTSYNTLGNVHYTPNVRPLSADGGVALRGNFAGIGYIYDSNLDVFYPSSPGPKYILDTETYTWKKNVTPLYPCPNDGHQYEWNDETNTWSFIQ